MAVSGEAGIRIIKEARKLFFSRGYTSVSMTEIAKELGMSKKTLYRHFAGKEELLLAGITDYRQDMEQGANTILDDEEIPFPAKASQMFSHMGRMLYAINPVLLQDIKESIPHVWQQIETYNVQVSYNRISRLLDIGIQEGYLRHDLNKNLTILLYISVISAILNPEFMQQMPQALKDEIPFTPGAIFEGVISIIMQGILK